MLGFEARLGEVANARCAAPFSLGATMARKNGRVKAPTEEHVNDFRHTDSLWKNNPLAGIAPTYEVRERQTSRYAYDPHLDPQLMWAGKVEHTSFEVDVVSPHIHEWISTKAILRVVKRPESAQLVRFSKIPVLTSKQAEICWSLGLGGSFLAIKAGWLGI